jgi:hypothetical protein
MKHGVRIFPPYKPREDVIWIYQTIQRDESKQYVVDKTSDGKLIHTFVSKHDDKGIAEAVRAALAGNLKMRSDEE